MGSRGRGDLTENGAGPFAESALADAGEKAAEEALEERWRASFDEFFALAGRCSSEGEVGLRCAAAGADVRMPEGPPVPDMLAKRYGKAAYLTLVSSLGLVPAPPYMTGRFWAGWDGVVAAVGYLKGVRPAAARAVALDVLRRIAVLRGAVLPGHMAALFARRISAAEAALREAAA